MTGLLILKLGGTEASDTHGAHVLSALRSAIAAAGLDIDSMVVVNTREHTFDFHMITKAAT